MLSKMVALLKSLKGQIQRAAHDSLDQPSWVNDLDWKKVKKEMRKEPKKFK